MSIIATVFLCVCTFAIAVMTCAAAFVPEKYDWNWWNFFGWLLFAASIICHEVAKK
jgi:hypothetical protein